MGMFQPQQNPATSVMNGMMMGMARNKDLRQQKMQQFSMEQSVANQQRLASNESFDRMDSNRKFGQQVKGENRLERAAGDTRRQELETMLMEATPDTWTSGKFHRFAQANPELMTPENQEAIRQQFKLDENFMPDPNDPLGSGYSPHVNATDYLATSEPHAVIAAFGAIDDITTAMGPQDWGDPAKLDQYHDMAYDAYDKYLTKTGINDERRGVWLNVFEEKWKKQITSHQAMGKAALDNIEKQRKVTEDQKKMRDETIGQVMSQFYPNLVNEKDADPFGFGGDPTTGTGKIDPKKAPVWRGLRRMAVERLEEHPGWTVQKIFDDIRQEVEKFPEVYGDTWLEAVKAENPSVTNAFATLKVPLGDGTHIKWDESMNSWVQVDPGMGASGAKRVLDPANPLLKNLPAWARRGR